MKQMKLVLGFSLAANVVMLGLLIRNEEIEKHEDRHVQSARHIPAKATPQAKAAMVVTPSPSSTTAMPPPPQEVPDFDWLQAPLRSELQAKLSDTESMISSARAKASAFATAADYAEIAALERQRLNIIRSVIGEAAFTNYMLYHTGIGEKLRELTKPLKLTDSELSQLMNASSDGVSLDQDQALDWIEKHRGADAAITLDFRADPQMKQIEGFWQRYGIQGNSENALNCLRTLSAADASEVERQAAEQALRAMIPPERWNGFAESFQVLGAAP
jgi:hypothetical protein